MIFRLSFCSPFSPDINELGDMPGDNIIPTFRNIAWLDFLKQMQNEDDSKIHFSPSLEIENKENLHGLAISIVGEPGNYEWYIFYRRPKEVKMLFGLIKKQNEQYTTDITGQTEQDVITCIEALLKNDLAFLEHKVR